MYNKRTKTMSFDVTDVDKLAVYEDVLNDPLCTIISDETDVIEDKTFDPESGRPTSSTETIMRSVKWTEKVLL